VIFKANEPHGSAELRPGRCCPAAYGYSPSVLAREAELHADTIYVVGGLYGNPRALEQVLQMAHAEPGGATIVFNGDFNWFNVDASDFAAINGTVLQHIALRGNVETEIAHDDDSAGCGCAYPDDVADDDVQRSNEIIARLRHAARALPDMRTQLGALPMHLVAEVAGVRIGIVHGDADSLAGWAYSERALSSADGVRRAARHFEAARVRAIVSTHTCLPVAMRIDTALGACALFNSGSAGMPNFRDTRFGVITRIATGPASLALYGSRIGTLFIDALPVHYDEARWLEAFLTRWPKGSAAYDSYFRRMSDGPAYELSHAVRGGVGLRAGARLAAMSSASTR
jgi:hypothetical protein